MAILVSQSNLDQSAWGLPPWFFKTLKYLVLEVFFLITLGGAVRVMNAGLACPDWPLCFGDFIPDYHPQVYFEFIHRALAGIVSLATVTLVYFLTFKSYAPRSMRMLGVLALLVLFAQVIFGGLTVLWQLQAQVVAAHLALATIFFSLLLWVYLSLKNAQAGDVKVHISDWAAKWTTIILAAVFAQLLLGGLVASHYAALVCTEFPKCQGQWFPSFTGVVGLHVIHRLGAYTVFVLLWLNAVMVRRATVDSHLRRLALFAFLLICVQVALGVANVLLYTPPLISVIHLSVGILILSVLLRQRHRIHYGS